MILRGVVLSRCNPRTDCLWVKPGKDNKISLWVYNGGWKEISGNSSTPSGDFATEEWVTEQLSLLQNTINEDFVTKEYLSDQTFLTESSDIIQKLLDEVFPLTLTVSGGGTYKEGTSQNITVSWSLKQGSEQVVPESVTVNGESVTGNSTTFTGVTQTTTYTVKAVYNGQEKTGSVTVRFVYPSYIGAVSTDFSVSNDTVVALTELIRTSRSTTWTGNLSNQKICYAYPKSYGALISIKDGNNFENISAYSQTELLITENDYNTDYYVYLLNDPTTQDNVKQVYS